MIFFSYIDLPKMSCRIKDATGIECPGCGIQRSIELLINGRIGESMMMYPALIPLILTFVMLAIHLWKKKNYTLNLTLIFLTLAIALILGFYIFKFIR